jgi:hypothetical protein
VAKSRNANPGQAGRGASPFLAARLSTRTQSFFHLPRSSAASSSHTPAPPPSGSAAHAGAPLQREKTKFSNSSNALPARSRDSAQIHCTPPNTTATPQPLPAAPSRPHTPVTRSLTPPPRPIPAPPPAQRRPPRREAWTRTNTSTAPPTTAGPAAAMAPTHSICFCHNRGGVGKTFMAFQSACESARARPDKKARPYTATSANCNCRLVPKSSHNFYNSIQD